VFHSQKDADIFANGMAYSISRSPDKVSIIVPRRFSPLLFVFFPIWIFTAVMVTVNKPRNDTNLSIESVLVPILFGLAALSFGYPWLWNIGGREELHFTSAGLEYRRVLFGITRTREFPMSLIIEPRFVSSVHRRKSHTPSGLGFNYQGEQVRIGDNLTQQEAREIVDLVTNQVPSTACVWDQYDVGLAEPEELLTLKLK
jgi:hypothetical protein